LEHALEYLRANFKEPGTTVAFRVDTDNNGTVDSLVVFQDAGTVPGLGNLEVPDLVVLLRNLAGVESATLGNSPGANVVQIQDTQLPEPEFALASNGITFYFSEEAYVPSPVSSLALIMYENSYSGTHKLPNGVTGNGTPTLTIQYNTTLGPTDWATFVYGGTDDSNAFRDAVGNVVDGGVVFVLGGSGNNTINLDAYPHSIEIEISGYGGNDTITGHKGIDRISGGAGADTLTGGDGEDRFIFEQGDSPAVTVNLGGNNALDNGDTFSFANGVDLITDFKKEGKEAIDLERPGSDYLGNNIVHMGPAPNNGQAADQGYFVVQGDYNANTGIFTVDTIAGSSTLIVWDGDPTGGVTQTGIVLSGVTPDKLSLGHGWIGHL